MFNFRILPSKAGFTQDTPPSPQKTMLKCGPNIFAAYKTTLSREGWGEGSPWCEIRRVGLLCVRKGKILNTFCPRLYLIHLDG